MPWWQKGNCDSVLDAPKFYVEIKKADICIDDDNFSVYYDRKTNINYYVSCIDAIYVIDNKTQEKYTLSDVQEQELFPIKELLQMINDQVPVKEAQVTTETGFNINIMDQCDLDIKNIYNQNNQKIYTNCLSVSYDEMSLGDALNSHTIDLKHIYEYIDHTSKYAEAIKDSELDGRFIYKNLLYSIVACDKNTLVYTPLDNHDDYQVCQVIK